MARWLSVAQLGQLLNLILSSDRTVRIAGADALAALAARSMENKIAMRELGALEVPHDPSP